MPPCSFYGPVLLLITLKKCAFTSGFSKILDVHLSHVHIFFKKCILGVSLQKNKIHQNMKFEKCHHYKMVFIWEKKIITENG